LIRNRRWPVFAIKTFSTGVLMRANDQIVPGDFLGGEIEPGTFHCGWTGPSFPETVNESGSGTASDEQVAPAQVRSAAPAAAARVLTDPDAGQEAIDAQA
jgi:hypothetical protein